MNADSRELFYRHSGKTEEDDRDYQLKGFLFRDKPTKAMRRVLEKPLSFSHPTDSKRTTIERNLPIFFRMQKYYDEFYDIPTFFHVIGQDLGWNYDVTVAINKRYKDARCVYLFNHQRPVPIRASDDEKRLSALVDGLRRAERHGPWAITENRAAYIDAMRDNWKALYQTNHRLLLDFEPAMPYFDEADVDWKVPRPSRQDGERPPLNTAVETNQVVGPGTAIIMAAIEKIKTLHASDENEAYLDIAFRLEMLGHDVAELEEKVKREKEDPVPCSGTTDTAHAVGSVAMIIEEMSNKVKGLETLRDNEEYAAITRRLEVLGHDAAELEKAAGEQDDDDAEYERFRAPSPN
ncbi:hypothetical protein GE09DRAFT_1189843 [Coniochaeta sp. 2T2.1]|nr:hypothetical protein GE09DRAFT_1189843 [Coniochaeta sp. 2T2.1]